MADNDRSSTESAPAAAPGPGAGGEPGRPAAQGGAPLLLKTQYVKDLSYENPHAPAIFAELDEAPDIRVEVEIVPHRLEARDYEVVLNISVTATLRDKTAFLVELDFAGLVSVAEGVAETALEPLLYVEAPRFLFPFARAIIAEVTRDGGYPPLLISPMDFGRFHAKKREAAAAQAAAVAEAGGAS